MELFYGTHLPCLTRHLQGPWMHSSVIPDLTENTFFHIKSECLKIRCSQILPIQVANCIPIALQSSSADVDIYQKSRMFLFTSLFFFMLLLIPGITFHIQVIQCKIYSFLKIALNPTSLWTLSGHLYPWVFMFILLLILNDYILPIIFTVVSYVFLLDKKTLCILSVEFLLYVCFL